MVINVATYLVTKLETIDDAAWKLTYENLSLSRYTLHHFDYPLFNETTLNK